MESSPELEVLKTHTYELELALKNNFRHIIDELRNCGLVKSDVYDRVKETNSLLSPLEKSGLLVGSIVDVVKLSSSKYNEFVKILSGNVQYNVIVSKLQG